MRQHRGSVGVVGPVDFAIGIVGGEYQILDQITQLLNRDSSGELPSESLCDGRPRVVETPEQVEQSNHRPEIHGTDDAGTPTGLPRGRQPIQAMLRDGWNDARIELGLKVQSGRYGAVKTPLFTPLYEWAGVAGFYFPFTGEANLRSGIPAVDVPKMLAHEMAHQRGVAPESEANFWGFLAAVNAANPHARYSALVFAQRQLMLGLMRQAPDTVARLVQLRSPGVQRDIDDAREYWMRFSGHGTRIGTAVNDAYLRSNRVVGGVENYSHSALLFIAYARARGGKLVD